MKNGDTFILLDKVEKRFKENFMSNIDFHAISNGELVDRLEKGEMQTCPNLHTEFMRRMEELGTLYTNTPKDEARWLADITSEAQRK